jgi:murein DD-endopeptidase MepM/ murein hydrolase activator NlpD
VRRFARLSLAALPVLLSGALLLGAPERGERLVFEPGRTYTAWFYDGRTDLVWARLSAAARAELGTESSLADLRLQLFALTGFETGVQSEHEFDLAPDFLYVRTASFEAGDYHVTWVLQGEEIVGFSLSTIQLAAETRFSDYVTRTPLRLPFDGNWRVYQGGHTVLENYHAVAVDQRFAYDIVGTDDQGRVYTGAGTSNQDFPGFGRPVLAPADGTVREAVDGIPDNTPRQTGPGHAAGNRVVIDHGNGEYSMLAHFRQGSVRVRPGDLVRAGDVLGECGNSGNSTAPHIHYHLQNTATWFASDGLPAQFRGYVADGRFVPVGEPFRGQLVSMPLPPGLDPAREDPEPAARTRPQPPP